MEFIDLLPAEEVVFFSIFNGHYNFIGVIIEPLRLELFNCTFMSDTDGLSLISYRHIGQSIFPWLSKPILHIYN